jgi:hypothetical protein
MNSCQSAGYLRAFMHHDIHKWPYSPGVTQYVYISEWQSSSDFGRDFCSLDLRFGLQLEYKLLFEVHLSLRVTTPLLKLIRAVR